ncbi:MAG: serine--tRNA ligase, partial [Dehalococcoidia bacterium]|nr:serine--tRNA ligase [Dehalococcoidia bacterium]
MLDIKLIRENPELVRQSLEKRGDSFALDSILEIEGRYRNLLRQTEGLRAKHNETSKQLGQSKERPPQLIAQMRQLGDQISSLQQQTKEAKAELDSLLLELPNMPHPSVPLGTGAADNVVVRTCGKPRELSFEPLPHWELGEKLDIIDFQRGVKLAGTRFYVLKGLGAHLQRALISFMLDVHVRENGYKEIYLPSMVKRECMVGSGNLPKFGDNLYHDDEDDFWFIPTAEVPLTNLHRDEILSADSLPLRYVAHTPCFRREKLAAGTDTRGIKRGHQFDKVELYKLTDPDSSDEELEKLVADAEDICRRLDIAHRVV